MLKTERIMLIESNPKDAENILITLESLNNKYKWCHFKTKDEALEYLQKEKNLPQLILFGLEHGDYESIEFLKTIKNNNNLKLIPIVMISTSDDQFHVLESFNHGAAGYMVKSNDHLELAGLINTIMQYWNICELPKV